MTPFVAQDVLPLLSALGTLVALLFLLAVTCATLVYLASVFIHSHPVIRVRLSRRRRRPPRPWR